MRSGTVLVEMPSRTSVTGKRMVRVPASETLVDDVAELRKRVEAAEKRADALSHRLEALERRP